MSEPETPRHEAPSSEITELGLADAVDPADAPEREPHWSDDPPTVGAVLVTHNGATWLPKVLGSFAQMVHAPDVWRAVDVESDDGSAALVRDSFGRERVLHAPRGTGFGEAARVAVDAMPRTDWVWLLHDDAAVVPTTLAGLLDVATSADDIGIVGPKVREWPSLRRILEVGVTVTGSGVRETGLETGEPDAGQHDRPRDVLAVGTAGMLIRRDVWDALDGFDADFPMYFDDIDLGWRAARAGYRVRTAPSGVLFHAEATQRGIRQRVRGDQPRWERRRAAMWAQLANVGPFRFWWQYLRLFVGGLARMFGFLITQDSESAGDEAQALRAVYTRPFRLWKARRRHAATATRSARSVKPLMAPAFATYQHGYEAVRAAAVSMVRPESVQTTGRRSTALETTVLDPEPDEFEDMDDGASWLRQRPWFGVVVGLVMLSLLAGRALWSGLARGVEGGALPRSPETAGGWWSLLLSGDRAAGLSDGFGPIFSLPLAIASTPVWSRPDLVVTVVMLFAVPLAALTAHRLGRLITPRRVPRTVWAVSYGALVAAVGAVPQGRIGTVVALIVAPIIINQAWQMVQAPGPRIAIRLGIAIAVAAAFAPIMLPISLLAFIIVWLIGQSSVTRSLAIAAVVAAVLTGPWLIARGWPNRWWWEAGFAVPGRETLFDVVMGRAGGVAAPWWLSVPLLVLGVAALLPVRTRTAVQVCWAFALICLGFALYGHLSVVSTASGRVAEAAWVGVPAVLWLAGLATAALVASPAWAQAGPMVARIALVVALVFPLGVAGWWVVRGVDDPLSDNEQSNVPAFLADLPGQTLVIERIDGADSSALEYDVVRGAGGYLGEEALVPSADDQAGVTDSVQHLLGRATDQDIAALRDAGISAVYVPQAAEYPELSQRIDAAPGIEQTGSDNPDARAWVLADPPREATTDVPWWKRLVSGAHVAAWFLAVLLIAPVRRRNETPSADAEFDEAPESRPVHIPDDSTQVVSR